MWYALLVNTVHDTKCYLCLLALPDIDISREPCVVFISGEFRTRGKPLEKPSLNSLQGSAKLSPLSPSPRPSEFCTDEDNIVNRSAMDALRYLKK